MKPSDHLTDFVRDALRAGHPRAEIARAITAAGWSEREAEEALNAWADDPIGLPVPRPKASVSAAEAFFYALMFISLAVVAVHVTQLGFELIKRAIPDPVLGETIYGHDRTIRRSIASLIVFAPLFFWLNARSLRATRDDPGKRLSPVRRWLTYLTLLIGAVTLLGDLIWLVFSLLQGELTAQVAAKAVFLAVVAGTVMFYFRTETREGVDAA